MQLLLCSQLVPVRVKTCWKFACYICKNFSSQSLIFYYSKCLNVCVIIWQTFESADAIFEGYYVKKSSHHKQRGPYNKQNSWLCGPVSWTFWAVTALLPCVFRKFMIGDTSLACVLLRSIRFVLLYVWGGMVQPQPPRRSPLLTLVLC